MLQLPHLAEIERHLLLLSPLADAIESRGMRVADRVRDWIREAEEIMRRHGVVEAGDLAVIRTELAAAVRAPPVAAAAPSQGRPRPRRSRHEQAAADALARAARVVEDAVASSRQLSQEGERLARQIASVAKVKGHRQIDSADWGAVSTAWEQASRDPDLVNAATHLVGLVGRMNAMLLFMRAQAEV